MARRPDNKSMETLDAGLSAQVDQWIVSNKWHTAASIYRRFNLVEHGINPRTFRMYVAKLRGKSGRAGRPDVLADACSASGSLSSLEELDSKLIGLVHILADAQDPKHLPNIAAMMSVISGRMKLRMLEERHEVWHEETRRKLESAKEAIQSQGSQGSKDLRVILEQVAAATITLDEALRAIGDCIWIEIDKHMRGAA